MPLDPLWKPVTQFFPDSRAKRSVAEKRHILHGTMESVFCANCGRIGGMITKDWAAFVFYICNVCDEKYGHLPLPDIPEAMVRARSFDDH